MPDLVVQNAERPSDEIGMSAGHPLLSHDDVCVRGRHTARGLLRENDDRCDDEHRHLVDMVEDPYAFVGVGHVEPDEREEESCGEGVPEEHGFGGHPQEDSIDPRASFDVEEVFDSVSCDGDKKHQDPSSKEDD